MYVYASWRGMIATIACIPVYCILLRLNDISFTRVVLAELLPCVISANDFYNPLAIKSLNVIIGQWSTVSNINVNFNVRRS